MKKKYLVARVIDIKSKLNMMEDVWNVTVHYYYRALSIAQGWRLGLWALENSMGPSWNFTQGPHEPPTLQIRQFVIYLYGGTLQNLYGVLRNSPDEGPLTLDKMSTKSPVFKT